MLSRHMNNIGLSFVSVPNADLFAIRVHYINGDVEGLAGLVDFCCADQMSRIELINMAREFNLDVESCSIWWSDRYSESKGLREIKTDMDALTMAENVDSSREVCVWFKLANSDLGLGVTLGFGSGENDQDEEHDAEENHGEDSDLECVLLQIRGDHKHKNGEEDSDFHDSDYSFSHEPDGEGSDTSEPHVAIIPVSGEPVGLGDDIGLDSEYEFSDELHSCSSTDEDELDSGKPKYFEFNEECDMKNPQLKIGMKFRSFAQFKEAVKNYGIKNRYVMKFKPNSKKRCKAICKKGCPFYLWASPMVKDSRTVQIKSGRLLHECTRDHTNRHVNAEWIAKAYLEQFRADPSWKIQGIIQAVKTNQEINISRLKAYRAKCIALR